MQARYVMDIGMILEDDAHYADGKGRGYYIDYVLNQSGIRQWSLKNLPTTDMILIRAFGRNVPVTVVW